MQSLKKRPLVMGTLLLTLSGILTRCLGFWYRIYLSRKFGAENIGLLQLTAPVLAVTYSICAAGSNTAVSKTVSACVASRKGNPGSVWLASVFLSLPVSALCAAAVYLGAPFLSANILLEPRLIPYIRILAFAVPFSTLHACTNGLFYGLMKSHVPALSQFAEQACRILFVTVWFLFSKDQSLSVVIWGMVFGEACGFFCDCLYLRRTLFSGTTFDNMKRFVPPLAKIAVPTSANRLTLNLMQSFEAIVLPGSLRQFGYTQTEALSLYGVLTGMAMPFILFPNALTTSLSTILMPEISASVAQGKQDSMETAIRRTTSFCILLGGGFSILFLLFGKRIGALAFQEETAGEYLSMLALVCPFLYLNTALSGIVQGLGKIVTLYMVTVICLALRLAFVLLLVPKFGMPVYFWGLFTSQVLQSILCLELVKQQKKS